MGQWKLFGCKVRFVWVIIKLQAWEMILYPLSDHIL